MAVPVVPGLRGTLVEPALASNPVSAVDEAAEPLMSDASLPNTTLRQRFDAFIAANTHKKASETDFRRKGSLGVGLIITDTLMSKPPSFPLNPDDFLADAGTQD